MTNIFFFCVVLFLAIKNPIQVITNSILALVWGYDLYFSFYLLHLSCLLLLIPQQFCRGIILLLSTLYCHPINRRILSLLILAYIFYVFSISILFLHIHFLHRIIHSCINSYCQILTRFIIYTKYGICLTFFS